MKICIEIGSSLLENIIPFSENYEKLFFATNYLKDNKLLDQKIDIFHSKKFC